MTKSELRNIIREVLKEELSNANLKEGAFSGGYAGDNSLTGGKVGGMGASTQPGHSTYLKRLKSKNPDLVSTTTIKGKDIKPGMITQAGQAKEVEVKKNNRGETKVYIMHTNNYDGFWDVDEDMEVMLDPDDTSKPFTGDYKELLKKGLKESAEVAEDENELEEGIFGNKYKGMDILVFRGNGKDEPIAIANVNAGNDNLVNFQNAHAKKNNNDKSDYQLVAATDKAVDKYKKALKSVPDVTTNLPQWVQQYIDDSKAKASRDFEDKQLEKEREIQARKDADRKHYQKLGAAKDPDDDYVYVKGNGNGTYKYREDLEESLTVDSIFEGLYN